MSTSRVLQAASDSGRPAGLAQLRSGIRELRERPPGQMPVLDALRALAVLLVAAGHAIAWWEDAGGRALGIAKFPLFYFGWTGVDLFFILSGFLIGRQLWREYARTGSVRVVRFVLRRGFRIWPLYVAFAIGTPLLTAAPVRLSDWLFYGNYAPHSVMGGWSLATEEQFYLILPAAVALAARVLGLRGWTYALPALIAAVEVARLLTARHLFAQGLDPQSVKLAMYEAGHLRCEGLLVGALIALVDVRFPSFLRPTATRRRMQVALGTAAVAAVLSIGLRTAAPVVLPYLSLAIGYGGVTVALLMLRSAPAIRRIGLESITLYRASRLSYGVYLNHFFVVKWVLAVSLPLLVATLGNNHLGFLVGLVLSLAASFAVAALSFVLIEHPFLALRSAVLTSESPGKAPERPLVVEAQPVAAQPDPVSAPEPVAGRA